MHDHSSFYYASPDFFSLKEIMFKFYFGFRHVRTSKYIFCFPVRDVIPVRLENGFIYLANINFIYLLHLVSKAHLLLTVIQ